MVFTVGEKLPAMSISWDQPQARNDSGFIVLFSDLPPDDDGFDDVPMVPVCMHCLLEDGDEQLGRGLDMAKLHGQVDFDPDAVEWFVPEEVQRRPRVRQHAAARSSDRPTG